MSLAPITGLPLDCYDFDGNLAEGCLVEYQGDLYNLSIDINHFSGFFDLIPMAKEGEWPISTVIRTKMTNKITPKNSVLLDLDSREYNYTGQTPQGTLVEYNGLIYKIENIRIRHTLGEAYYVFNLVVELYSYHKYPEGPLGVVSITLKPPSGDMIDQLLIEETWA